MKSLFKLIKSLHPSEKRYINLKLQSNKSNSLLHRYFETLQNQKEYDFELISEKHDNTSPKVLKNSLRNLYSNVLRYLRSYKAQSDDEGLLADMLRDVKNLRDKSMLDEAGKLNGRLLRQSSSLEYFFYEKEALNNKWNLAHLKGELSFEFTNKIEELLEEVIQKEYEIFKINKKYRTAVTLYYQYFFFERDENTKFNLIELTKTLKNKDDMGSLKSSKARMSSYEILALGAIIQGDLLNHHNVRKDQLKLLLTSEVFSKDYISQILVLSNLFTYLKSVKAIDVLKDYMEYMKSYFLPLVEKNSDGVLIEKYYDIYFQNQIYIQNWFLDKEVIFQLLNEFKTVSKKEFKRNNLLLSRVYLSFSQLLILSGDYKHSFRHLIEYQSLSLDKKNSTNFLDSELHLLMLYFLRDKQDVFDRIIETLRRKERIDAVVFNEDQKILFQAFYSIYKGDKVTGYDYKGRKGWLKVYLDALSGITFQEAVKNQFNSTRFVSLPNETKFLEWLSRV